MDGKFAFVFSLNGFMMPYRDVIPIGEGDIATMCLQLSSQPREYSYFSPRTMATWAGPGYWQFKPKHKCE